MVQKIDRQLKTIFFLVFTAVANYVTLLLGVIVSGDLPHRYLEENETNISVPSSSDITVPDPDNIGAVNIVKRSSQFSHETLLPEMKLVSAPTNIINQNFSVMEIQPRAFLSRSLDTFPCFLMDPQTKWWNVSNKSSSPYHHEGFFFLKTHKTGSSTGAGIHLRIAQRVATMIANKKKDITIITPSLIRHDEKNSTQIVTSTTPSSSFPMCQTRFDHSTARKMKYGDRNKEASFLWTILRDPTERAISQFFHFEVSRRQVEPTEENFRKFLLSKRARTNGYYLRTLSFRGYVTNKTTSDQSITIYSRTVQEIIDGYDFIAIMERMNESAVVLQMLLGLKTIDILYLNAKGSGGYDAGGYKGKCTHIQEKNVTWGMREFVRTSPEWQAYIKWDKILYDKANESLDMTIRALGRDRFQRGLRKFEHALEQARLVCSDKVTFPCSPDRDGQSPLSRNQTDCLWKDSGCGSECLDSIGSSLEFSQS